MNLAMTRNLFDRWNGGDQRLSHVGTVDLLLDNASVKSKGRIICCKDETSDYNPLRRNTSLKSWILAFSGSLMVLIWLLSEYLPNIDLQGKGTPSRSQRLVKNAVVAQSATTTITHDFQVYQPVLTPSITTGAIEVYTEEDDATTVASTSDAVCEVLLMQYTFGNSYGAPFVGSYTPPSCRFNRVSMNFTVTSSGRQFDRLALMYFNDTEVWRTSTAEPTAAGIRWEYIKDMTEYAYFWTTPQKIIFDLGNVIDSTYTGYYYTTLTATFFTAEETASPAELIIPISARKSASNAPSVFMLPGDIATNTLILPQNINRAVFSISACGQATEEFWWSNVLQSDTDTFLPYVGELYGYSPWREVQVLIDGTLAGVHWPFPVIFTGGVVPGLWRPIVGIDAFDLREHEIDISPFLPLICDGKEHTFEIRVVGVDDNGQKSGFLTQTVGSSWYVTGKIFLWLDSDSSSITTGKAPTLSLPAPTIILSSAITKNSTGANETLIYTIDVSRSLTIESTIKTQNSTRLAKWTQSLSATNYGLYTEYGAIEVNNQSTIGEDQSLSNHSTTYKSEYSYPLFANSSYIVAADGSFSIGASIIRGLDLSIQGTPVFPTGLQSLALLSAVAPLLSTVSGTQLHTQQNGTAIYLASAAGTATSFGSTSQVLTFKGTSGDDGSGSKEEELYYRDVAATNGTVVADYESLTGKEITDYHLPEQAVPQAQQMVLVSAKSALGRGKGNTGDSKRMVVQDST